MLRARSRHRYIVVLIALCAAGCATSPSPTRPMSQSDPLPSSDPDDFLIELGHLLAAHASDETATIDSLAEGCPASAEPASELTGTSAATQTAELTLEQLAIAEGFVDRLVQISGQRKLGRVSANGLPPSELYDAGVDAGLPTLAALWCTARTVHSVALVSSPAYWKAIALTCESARLPEHAAEALRIMADCDNAGSMTSIYALRSAAFQYVDAGLIHFGESALAAAVEAFDRLPSSMQSGVQRASLMLDEAKMDFRQARYDTTIEKASRALSHLTATSGSAADLPIEKLMFSAKSLAMRARIQMALAKSDTSELLSLRSAALLVASEASQSPAVPEVERPVRVLELLNSIQLIDLVAGASVEQEAADFAMSDQTRAAVEIVLPNLGAAELDAKACLELFKLHARSFDWPDELWKRHTTDRLLAFALPRSTDPTWRKIGYLFLANQIGAEATSGLGLVRDRDRRLYRTTNGHVLAELFVEASVGTIELYPNQRDSLMELSLMAVERMRSAGITEQQSARLIESDAEIRRSLVLLERYHAFLDNADFLDLLKGTSDRQLVPKNVLEYADRLKQLVAARHDRALTELQSTLGPLSGYFARELDHQTIGLPMSEHDACLVLFVGEQMFVSWVVQPGRPVKYSVNREWTATGVRKWRDQALSDLQAARSWSELEHSVNLQLNPFARWILSSVPTDVERLYVVCPSELSDIPIEALPLASGRRAADVLQLSYVPSLLWLSSMTDEATRRELAWRSGETGALVVASAEGVDAPGRHLAPLIGMSTEASAVATSVRRIRQSERTRQLRALVSLLSHFKEHMAPNEMSAFEMSKFRELASAAGFVYLGAHGVKTPGDDLLSFFGVADPATHEYVTAESMLDLELRSTDLVLLAACSSLHAGFDQAEEPLGLFRPFLLSGVSSVVGPCQDVMEAYAGPFVRSFCGRLVEQGKTRAFHSVRNEMLLSDRVPPKEILKWRFTGVMDTVRQ